MTTQVSIESLNISVEKGTVKQAVNEAEVTDNGLTGDAHSGAWHRQVSLLAAEEVERFAELTNRKMAWGEFAENITTRGLNLDKVAILDRFIFDNVELEITQIGKACHHGCDIYKKVGACIMPKQGLFARVVSGGTLRTGLVGAWHPRLTRILVLTLSDRATQGVYADRSGPAIETAVSEHFRGRRDHVQITGKILPDNSEQLQQELLKAVTEEVDLILTTGGTGLGPRDMTPQVTANILEKNLTGFMEHIRLKYGASKPAALLSRGVAGTIKQTFIMNMPGSVKAVQEYTQELLPLWDHIRRMIHAIDQH